MTKTEQDRGRKPVMLEEGWVVLQQLPTYTGWCVYVSANTGHTVFNYINSLRVDCDE